MGGRCILAKLRVKIKVFVADIKLYWQKNGEQGAKMFKGICNIEELNCQVVCRTQIKQQTSDADEEKNKGSIRHFMPDRTGLAIQESDLGITD